MTKEVVNLKLQGNLLQQNAIKQIEELKAKVNNYFKGVQWHTTWKESWLFYYAFLFVKKLV